MQNMNEYLKHYMKKPETYARVHTLHDSIYLK